MMSYHQTPVDFFNQYSCNKYASNQEKNYKYLLNNTSTQTNLYGSIPTSIENFEKRFHALTNDIFKSFTSDIWKHIVVCGGTVTAALFHTQSDMINLTNGGVWPNANIDIFIHGMIHHDPHERKRLISLIFNTIKQSLPQHSIYYSETLYSYVSYSSFPYRPVQIVRVQTKDISEILNGFDIDCCAIAYQGPVNNSDLKHGKLWTIQRALDAFRWKRNVFNETLGGQFYEQRLLKYCKRGFSIVIEKKKYDELMLNNKNGLDFFVRQQDLFKDHSDYASTENRTRYVPFKQYSFEDFKIYFEKQKDIKESITRNPYILVNSLLDLLSNEDNLTKEENVTRNWMLSFPKYDYTKEIKQEHDNMSMFVYRKLVKAVKNKQAKLKMYISQQKNIIDQFNEQPKISIPSSTSLTINNKNAFHVLHDYYSKHSFVQLYARFYNQGSVEFWLDEIFNKRMKQRLCYDNNKPNDNPFNEVKWYGPRIRRVEWEGISDSDYDSICYWWKTLISEKYLLDGPSINMYDLELDMVPSSENDNNTNNNNQEKILDKYRVHISLKMMDLFRTIIEICEYCKNDPNPVVKLSLNTVPFHKTLLEKLKQNKEFDIVTHFKNDVIIPLEHFYEIMQILTIDKSVFQECVYFNSMEQLFYYTKNGITLSDLVSHLDSNKQDKQLFIQFLFFEQYKQRNAFVSENFKKCILEQDLYSISLLLRHSLLNNLQANIGYVEYSIDISHALSIWCWPYLLTPGSGAEGGVHYRYLVGFNRNRTKICTCDSCTSVSSSRKVDSLHMFNEEKMKFISDLKSDRQWETLYNFLNNINVLYAAEFSIISQQDLENDLVISFQEFEEQRIILEKILKNSPLISRHIVGVDIFGDEKMAPFNPFASKQFLSFIESQNQLSSKKFGIHIQFDVQENLIKKRKLVKQEKEEDESNLELAYLRVIFNTLVIIKNANTNIPLRISNPFLLNKIEDCKYLSPLYIECGFSPDTNENENFCEALKILKDKHKLVLCTNKNTMCDSIHFFLEKDLNMSISTIEHEYLKWNEMGLLCFASPGSDAAFAKFVR